LFPCSDFLYQRSELKHPSLFPVVLCLVLPLAPVTP